MKRKNHTGSDQDSSLKEAGCLLFFTSVIFLMIIGYPSILNSSQPQQVFAEPSPIDFYNYNPTINTAFLVSPQAVFPNYDPFYQWVQDYQDYMINKILPSAEAINITPSTPTPDFFDDFTTDKGWSFNGTDVIDIFTATGTINITQMGTGAGSPPNFRTMGSLEIDSMLSGGWDETKWSLRTKVQMNATTNGARFALLGVSEFDQTVMSGSTNAQNCNADVSLQEFDKGCMSFLGSPTNHWIANAHNETVGTDGYGNINMNLTEPYTLDSFIFPEVIVDGEFIRWTVYSDAGYQHVLGCTNDKFDPSTGDCDFSSGNNGVNSGKRLIDETQSTKWTDLKYIWFGTASGSGSDFVGTTGSIHEVSFWNGINITQAEGNLPEQVTGLNIIQNLSPWAFMTWDDVVGADSYNVYWKHVTFQPEFKRIAVVTDNKFTDKRIPYHKLNCVGANSVCDKYLVSANNATGEGLNSTEFNFGLMIPTRSSNVEPLSAIPDRIEYRQAKWLFDGNWAGSFTVLANLAQSVYYRVGDNETDIHIASSSANDGTFATTGNEIFGQKITVPDMNLTRIIQKFDFNSAFPTDGKVTAFVWNSTDGFIDSSNDTVHFPISADLKDVTACTVSSCDTELDQSFLFPTQVPLSAGEYVFGIRFEGVVSTGTHGQGVISSGSDAGVRVSDSDFTDGVNFIEDVGADSNIQVIGVADDWVLCTAIMDTDDDDFVCPVAIDLIDDNQEVWIQSFATTATFPFNSAGNSAFGRSAIVPLATYSTRELGFTPVSANIINMSAFSAGTTAFFAIPALPEAPTGLAVIQDMADEAELDWDDQSDADSYLVFRNDNFVTGTENANGTWQYREQLRNVASGAFCIFTVNADNVQLGSPVGSSALNDCYMFKTLPRDLMNNTVVQFRYDFTNTGGANSASGIFTTSNIPNAYDRNDESQFPSPAGSRNWSGEASVISLLDIENLSLNGGEQTELMNEPDWGIGNTPDTDFVNIVFSMIDNNLLAQNLKLKIFWINVTDKTTGEQKAFYNFTGSSKTSDPEDPSCGNDCERGTFEAGSFNSTNFELIGSPTLSEFTDTTIDLIQSVDYKISAVNATGAGENSTLVDFGLIDHIANVGSIVSGVDITLNWDQATTSHLSDPLTGVRIDRSLGTNGTWTVVEPDKTLADLSDTICGFGKGADFATITSLTSGRHGMCTMFISIPTSVLNNTEVFVDWEMFVTDTPSGQSTQLRVINNGYDKGGLNQTEFPLSDNGFDVPPSSTFSDEILLNHVAVGVGGGFARQIESVQYTTSNSIDGFSSIFVQYFDNNVPSAEGSMRIYSVNVTRISTGETLLFWDFTTNDVIVTAPVTTSETDRGTHEVLASNVVGGFETITTEDDLATSFDDFGLDGNTNYFYRLKGVSAISTGAFDEETSSLTSPVIPSAINDLVASPSGLQCNISWTLPSANGASITGHRILRAVDGGSFIELVANTGSASTSHIDGGLQLNSLYQYDVRAINSVGEALGSNIANCTPVTTGIPNDPTGLVATNQGNGDVVLTWDDPNDASISGYQIERKLDNGAFIIIVPDTGNANLTFTDTTTVLGNEYTFRISAINTFGISGLSNEETIVTLMPPNAPTLSAVQVGALITLTWTLPTADGTVNGFKIERNVNGGSFSDLVANTTNTLLTIDDSAVTKPNSYGYRVTALDDIPSESDTSNEVVVVFGSHVTVFVTEQDGSGYKGFGDVKVENSTFTQTKSLDSTSKVIFDNLDTGTYNYTFIDLDNFILNKTFNNVFPVGTTSSSFTISALVFDVDCPNTSGTDVRIKLNYTDLQSILSYPATPVCDNDDKVSWSTTWTGNAGTDQTLFIADFISPRFRANADNFLVGLIPTDTTYSGSLNRIISDSFDITTASDVTINFDVFLGDAPAGGGGTGSGSGGSSGSGSTSIPSQKIVFESRLTGLTLLSISHMFIQPNDVIKGEITVGWDGEQDMTIKRISVGEFTDIIRFAERAPFDLDPVVTGAGLTARSEAGIEYTIFIPDTFCDEELGITLNCFPPELVIIPVEITFEFEEQDFIGTTEIVLDARPLPIDFAQLQTIALFVGILFSALVANQIRKGFSKKGKKRKIIRKRLKG